MARVGKIARQGFPGDRLHRGDGDEGVPAGVGGDGDDLDVVFVENVYDPDPADEQYETTILYLIRDHGHLRIETDHWTMGLFSLDTWRRVLRETGFEVHEGLYQAGEDHYTTFACVRTG